MFKIIEFFNNFSVILVIDLNMINNKIYIAFGFHVSCYHSYRGDSNDSMGFGNDIKNIREIISELDKFNKDGIKVRGTWDIDNFYTLEKILPTYAPDIIANIKRRIEDNGDEDMIISYNNACQSVQTKDEFIASIKMAITNSKGSGLKDIFGKYVPIVRPQQMMFNPYDAKLYSELGIEAICLYNSYNSNDSFKGLIPQLFDAYNYYPLRYIYKDSQITVIPTISQYDIIELGSLEYIVQKLHNQQIKNVINHDCLIFLNLDADNPFWVQDKTLPFFTKYLHNFGGLRGLVKEVCKLDFVEFTTPYEFLKGHPAKKMISFGEDTASCNFAGYSSLAEKPFNHTIFTRLEKARALSLINSNSDKESVSFMDRVKLLSTSHFGLASPVLNYDREKAAFELSSQALNKEMALLKTEEGKCIIYNSTSSLISAVQVELEDNYLSDKDKLDIKNENLKDFALIPIRYYQSKCVKNALLILKFKAREKEAILEFKVRKATKVVIEDNFVYDNSYIKVENEKFHIYKYINYSNSKYPFESEEIKPIRVFGSGKAVLESGEISIYGNVETGRYNYIYYTLDFLKGTGVICDINYPYTSEHDQISTYTTSIGKYADKNWIEVAPFEIEFKADENTSVDKINFRDEMTTFKINDFREANKFNSSRDAFNNMVTGGFFALRGKKNLKFINHRLIASSMAYCPMRTRYLNGYYASYFNPFGTYYGRQPNYLSETTGISQRIFALQASHAASLAPSYNGAKELFSIFLSISEDNDTLIGFSKGDFITGEKLHSFNEDNCLVRVSPKVVNDIYVRPKRIKGKSRQVLQSTIKEYFYEQRFQEKRLKLMRRESHYLIKKHNKEVEKKKKEKTNAKKKI